MFANRLIHNFAVLTPSLLIGRSRSVLKFKAPVGRKLQSMCSCALEEVPKVDIDPSGIFKYILLRVYDKKLADHDREEPHIVIVRGYAHCNYHSDIYEEVQKKLEPLDAEPIGGGRINHDPDNKTISIYGYSQGYGKADHEITAKIIRESFPDYSITISDEGY